MGRRPTKAANNPFCKARIDAAKYNDSLFSKEKAAEFLGISVSTLSDYELGVTKTVPPDMVLKMADLYNAPELENYYCTNMCPLGGDMPKVDIVTLDRITVSVISSFRKVDETRELLLDIAENGIMNEAEKADLQKVLSNLEELEQIACSLKLWVKKNL